MNIERLRYLVVLSESRTFSEAADRLFTTQGNVSKQILALEKELGVLLADRSGLTVTLTEAGKAVIIRARTILNEYAALRQDAAAFSPSSRPVVRICSIPVMAHYQITEILSSFHAGHPRFRMDIREAEGVNIPEELIKRTADLAFARSDYLDNEEFEALPFCRDELAAVLPCSHPLAGRSTLDLNELKGESFLQLGPSTNLYDTFEESCRLAGFEPDVAYTGTRIENILELVEGGMGISLMMRRAAEYNRTGRIAILPLKEKITSEIALIRLRRARHSPAAKEFWNHFQESIGSDLDA